MAKKRQSRFTREEIAAAGPKRARPSQAAPPAKKRGARSQPLPGMEGVRNAKLDNLCEGIAEQRRVMNAAHVETQTDITAALQEMQRKGISVYKHGGIELARVPGAEKLRVRLTKEQGDADGDDLEDGGEFAEERRAAVNQE
jgi:hypothetical protein